MSIQTVLTVLTLFIQFGTVSTMVYGFSRFLNKPRESVEQRVTVLEVKLKELERDKDNLRLRCKEQDDTNEVLIHSTLALIEFEIQYCITEKKPMTDDLKKAKKDLHNYLAKK